MCYVITITLLIFKHFTNLLYQNNLSATTAKVRRQVSYFRYEYQGHGKEATENHRQRYESETSILLRCRHHYNWRSDQARDDHVIY